MRKILLVMLLIFPFIAHAQTAPNLNGYLGWYDIAKSKVDTQNGVLKNPTISGGGSIDSSVSILAKSGSVNSIVRSISDRWQDNVNVMDYCSRSDVNGVTDNTSCIQTAIYAVCNAAGGVTPWGSGGRVFFPPGVYVLTSVSFPCNGVDLAGANNGNVNSGYYDYRGTVFRLKTPDNTSAFAVGMTTSDYGGGISIHDISVDGTSMSSSSTVFDYSWLQHSTIKNISGYSITNFFREEGGAANAIEDVVILGLSGTGVEFYGDSSACTDLASCNKRADLLRVSRVNMNGTVSSTGAHTATCFSYHDFAQSLNVDHGICENALYGINAYCQASQGNNGEACPAFPRFYDFEAENCTNCVNISDGQDFEFSDGYLLGEGTSSTHVFNIYNTNFGGNPTTTSAGSYAQAFRWHGGRIGNSGGSAMYIGVSQFIVNGAQFFSANLSDTNSTIGAPDIEVSGTGSATMPQQGVLSDNLLCVASGQQPISQFQGGIILQSGVNYIKVHDNVTLGCSGTNTSSGQANGITDNSGKTGNDIHDN